VAARMLRTIAAAGARAHRNPTPGCCAWSGRVAPRST
jgi:hypothetical protein